MNARYGMKQAPRNLNYLSKKAVQEGICSRFADEEKKELFNAAIMSGSVAVTLKIITTDLSACGLLVPCSVGIAILAPLAAFAQTWIEAENAAMKIRHQEVEKLFEKKGKNGIKRLSLDDLKPLKLSPNEERNMFAIQHEISNKEVEL